MPPAVDRLARLQAGVVARHQVLAAGHTDAWLKWRLQRGSWQALHPGTYATFTGPLPWRSTAWAGVLYAGRGAALAGASAGFDLGIVRCRPVVVDVVVPPDRRVVDRPGLRVRTRLGVESCTVQASPPRTRLDETVLDLLPGCRDADAVVGLLCDGLRAGADPRVLRDLLAPRPRWRWRGLATAALTDCEAGVESPLERRYAVDVVRAHALPRFDLQVRQRLDGYWVRADARCLRFGVRVELDGRLAHPGGRTDADTWRDNDVLIASAEITLRYRWRHVAGDPCRTARQVAAALRSRGWGGTPRPCPRCPSPR